MEPSPSSPTGSGQAATAGGPDRPARPPGGPAGARWRGAPARTRALRPSHGAIAAAVAGVALLAALLAGTGYRYEPYAEQPLAVSSEMPADARPAPAVHGAPARPPAAPVGAARRRSRRRASTSSSTRRRTGST